MTSTISIPDLPSLADWRDWYNRREFFARLPRPLCVLLACDYAAMVPQLDTGAAAIETARRWLICQASEEECRVAARTAAHAARTAAHAARTAAHAAHAAAHAACAAHAAVYAAHAASDAAYAAVYAAHAASDAAYAAADAAHAARVLSLHSPTAWELLSIYDRDPSVRMVWWDCLTQECGYQPIAIVRKEQP